MRAMTLVLPLCTAALLFASSAEAGHKHRGHGHGHYKHGHGHPVYVAPPHRHAPRHYRRHHRHHGHGDGLKYVAGALVLGGIISAINQPPPAVVVRQPAPPYYPSGGSADYWYRLDAQGYCSRVHIGRDGREVVTDVAPGYCG